ncbi:MAG: biotin/lipoyl-binding protein, partial [Thermoanaerobaculia bacterium]|nr:biotin/lipoyl-binding protein [Thermoanaerobaculia bacterium]
MKICSTAFLVGLLGSMTFLVSCSGSEQTLDLVGTVERKTLEVAAPISEVIVEIPVAVGDRVSADQIVVRLDSAVAEAELAASEAAMAAAKAAESQAEREFQRIRGLQQARVSSRQDLDTAQRSRDESVALVAERAARVVQAQKRLSDLTLRSWGEGTLDELPFEVGERTSSGSVVAVIVADDQPFV